ncbi:protein COFACTOR ASSEMBLY OF COMPLEX C SUBUNIT B CCB2, chloroplastic isoform X2 [Aristolochia californica]|uniref:protein COFACTOR ASSEMBLY OF COMPLEX C SUBUNIT B CCB2, chloroplastic isoform X2 n=1 Tax=Aristolochia californica TaxID=171875 RepID=UPI0035DCD664
MVCSSLQLCFNFTPSTKLSSCFPVSSRSVATKLTSRVTTRWKSISASLNNSEESQQQQQLNVSVLRFTLGIPGFDESYLPRWIGVAFGSLLLLNHFFGSNFVTDAQIRSELLGICLAGYSITVPYLGKFLKGANLVDRSALPDGNRQIFLLSEGLSESLKEDLAWASYVLLKNTNTMSVLISLRDELCVRGYWNTPDDSSKADLFDRFSMQIRKIGFSQLKEALYFPKCSETVDWEMLPVGTLSILIQPVLGSIEPTKNIAFIFLASSASYSYNDRDREWIKAVANKFTGYDKASGQEGFQLDSTKAM